VRFACVAYRCLPAKGNTCPGGAEKEKGGPSWEEVSSAGADHKCCTLWCLVHGVGVVAVDGVAWSAFDLLRARLGNIVATEEQEQHHQNPAERMSNVARDQTQSIGACGISVITDRL